MKYPRPTRWNDPTRWEIPAEFGPTAKPVTVEAVLCRRCRMLVAVEHTSGTQLEDGTPTGALCASCQGLIPPPPRSTWPVEMPLA